MPEQVSIPSDRGIPPNSIAYSTDPGHWFQSKPAIHSTWSRPLIPVEAGHPFHVIPATHSRWWRPG